MDISKFLNDHSLVLRRMVKMARQETALITHKNKEGKVEFAMFVTYFDNPEHNERLLALLKEEGERIDAERESEEVVMVETNTEIAKEQSKVEKGLSKLKNDVESWSSKE